MRLVLSGLVVAAMASCLRFAWQARRSIGRGAWPAQGAFFMQPLAPYRPMMRSTMYLYGRTTR